MLSLIHIFFRNIERAGRCDQIAILLGHAVGFRFKIDGDLLAEVDLLRFVLQREGPERQRIIRPMRVDSSVRCVYETGR